MQTAVYLAIILGGLTLFLGVLAWVVIRIDRNAPAPVSSGPTPQHRGEMIQQKAEELQKKGEEMLRRQEILLGYAREHAAREAAILTRWEAVLTRMEENGDIRRG